MLANQLSKKNITNKVSSEVIESNRIQKQLKYMILLEAVTGVNRLYLICNRKFLTNCVTMLNFVIFLSATLIYNLSGLFNTSQTIYKNTQLMEFFVLCFCAVFLQKSSLENFFRSLSNVDALFNIGKDISIVTSIREHSIFLFVICVWNVLDFIISYIYFRHPAYDVYDYAVSYLTIAVNDIEVIFFCTLLGMVLKRLTIVNAHVAKEQSELNDKLATLTRRIKLDVSCLHKIYDMLQYSSSVLESVIAFPLIVIFTACGIVTIMMLRGIIQIDMVDYLSEDGVRYLWLYATIRCIKNGILILTPCYYGSLTIRRARSIRHTLQIGLSSSIMKYDIRKRRQLKAFYQLTRDNEFSYTLWGDIRLDMALPLNYYYMCLTYFIIVVQFAKFID